jgi:hypothetical protein
VLRDVQMIFCSTVLYMTRNVQYDGSTCPQATAQSRLEGRWKCDLQGPEADNLDGGWAVLSFQHLDGKDPN